MIISFARTTPALVLGMKTVTRRDWKDSHGAKFCEGMICDAWSNAPHRGGKKIGCVEITKKPYRESTADMTASDYINEGFRFMDKINYRPGWLSQKQYDDILNRWKMIFSDWRAKDETLWVVRFKLVDLTSYGRKFKRKYEKQLKVARDA